MGALGGIGMNHKRVEFRHPRDRNSGSLLSGEQMIHRLKLNVRASPVISQMDASFQVHRVRIRFQPRIEPAKERGYVSAFGLGEIFEPFQVAGLTE